MENENTLLPKFFGLHRVKPHKGRQVRFVVMGNIFATHKKVHERYDLKVKKIYFNFKIVFRAINFLNERVL